jgi:ATP-binding cassette subfamily B protein
MRPLYGMWDKSDKYVDEQNKIVRERLSGIRVVRAFNNDPREHGRAKHATEEMAKYMIRANVRGGYIEPCALFLLNLATVVMVAVAGGRAESGLLDRAGDIIAVVQYVMILSGALINLSWTIAWLPRLRVSVKRISEIHSSPIEEEAHSQGAIPDGYSISVEGVTFTYPSAKEPSLKNLSLEIKEGERVAIIGGTGSGKSTLVRLLIGLFRPSEGEIYLGGIGYSDMSRETLRAHYSTALQRGMIFEGTVRDNVAMGKPCATDEEILEVLSDVQMREFVTSHEEGLDYLLVGMGQNVSGGQKQRLGLARTVIRESDIYIFDDSFSALDYLTESRIRARLEERLRGKTVITVTQRVSTALGASRIYVMDHGEIVAHGTHEELLSSSDIYREICLSQIGEKALGGGACEK